VRWEERLLQEFDDLEQQAEGLHLAEREAVVAELSVSGYAEVELVSRLHASVGCVVHLVLRGGGSVDGALTRAGRDWVLVGQDRAETVVPTAAVLRARGVSERSVPEAVRGVSAKLGLGSALRQLAAEREGVAVQLVDGSICRGRLRRVGGDFVELAGENGQVELVALEGVVLLRRLLARPLLRAGLGVLPLDVVLELVGLDAPLAATTDLDGEQVSVLDERHHLGHRGVQHLRGISGRQEAELLHAANYGTVWEVSQRFSTVWLWITCGPRSTDVPFGGKCPGERTHSLSDP
jgi:hypothetical protein